MEWLGVLLLYLISGFMKKRQQNKNREIIESDPSWDNEEAFEKEDSSNNIEQLLNDLFEQNPKVPRSSTAVKEVLVEEKNNRLEEILETKSEELIEQEIIDEDNRISLDNQTDNFEDNIYHSKLADREELHFGNKWVDKINLKQELFNSRKSLRRSILIKEILDKPLAMRD